MPTFTSSSACSLIAVGSGEQSESGSKDIWELRRTGVLTPGRNTDSDETSESPDSKGISEVWVTELISEPLWGLGESLMKATSPVFQKYP